MDVEIIGYVALDYVSCNAPIRAIVVLQLTAILFLTLDAISVPI